MTLTDELGKPGGKGEVVGLGTWGELKQGAHQFCSYTIIAGPASLKLLVALDVRAFSFFYPLSTWPHTQPR